VVARDGWLGSLEKGGVRSGWVAVVFKVLAVDVNNCHHSSTRYSFVIANPGPFQEAIIYLLVSKRTVSTVSSTGFPLEAFMGGKTSSGRISAPGPIGWWLVGGNIVVDVRDLGKRLQMCRWRVVRQRRIARR
jgi:hypothetical protein